MVEKFLRKLAFRFGYNFTLRKLPQYAVRNRELKVPRDMEPEFVDIYAKTREYTLTSVERMYALYRALKYIHTHDIAGDLVECGVWRGGSCMLMAYTLLAMGDTSRKLYLYDTFTGMAKPQEVDIHKRDGSEQISRWESFQREGYNEWCYAPLQEVRSNMQATGYPQDAIIWVKGEVEQTLPATAPEQIALLRLDTDWYQSTYHELKHLYGRLAQQGILIIDDYGAYDGSRLATDQYFQENDIKLYLHRIDTAGRIAVKSG